MADKKRLSERLAARGAGWEFGVSSASAVKLVYDRVTAMYAVGAIAISVAVGFGYGIAWALVTILSASSLAFYVAGRAKCVELRPLRKAAQDAQLAKGLVEWRMGERDEARNERNAALVRIEELEAIEADRSAIRIEFNDDPIAEPQPRTQGARGVAIYQVGFLVRNEGPDSEFEAWIPHSSVYGAGVSVSVPYGGFHSCWRLSQLADGDKRRRFIPRGSDERVDLAVVVPASGVVQFLAPGRELYEVLYPPAYEITGAIEIRDVNRDGARVATTFRLKINEENQAVTLRVPEDSQTPCPALMPGLPTGPTPP